MQSAIQGAPFVELAALTVISRSHTSTFVLQTGHGTHFIFLIVFFDAQNILIFIKSKLSNIYFITYTTNVMSKNAWLNP
jgi:hypothetical protein